MKRSLFHYPKKVTFAELPGLHPKNCHCLTFPRPIILDIQSLVFRGKTSSKFIEFPTCLGSRRITSHSKRKAPGMARPFGEFPGGKTKKTCCSLPPTKEQLLNCKNLIEIKIHPYIYTKNKYFCSSLHI